MSHARALEHRLLILSNGPSGRYHVMVTREGSGYSRWNGIAVSGWLEDVIERSLTCVCRMPHAQALKAATTHGHDYRKHYIEDLSQVIDLDSICHAGLRLGVDPMGGAGMHYWGSIGKRWRLDLTVVSDVVDPTCRFMTLDWDGQIRMDPSSPDAMQRLIDLKVHCDIAFACDTDHGRYGIATPTHSLLAPNHYLCLAIDYLFHHRPQWRAQTAIGKTVVSTQLIDRVAAQLGRKLFKVPAGFKWFVTDLLDGNLDFAGEESAGESFLRRDGAVWTNDEDGIRAALLAGEMVESVLTRAPGNGALIGGIKVSAASGWFAARPSGTEDIYDIYCESFPSPELLQTLLQEAQVIGGAVIGSP